MNIKQKASDIFYSLSAPPAFGTLVIADAVFYGGKKNLLNLIWAIPLTIITFPLFIFLMIGFFLSPEEKKLKDKKNV